MGRDGLAPGSAALHLVGGVPLLRPEEQVFSLMLNGWRSQQLARNLAFSTIGGREKAVRAFRPPRGRLAVALDGSPGRRMAGRPAGGPQPQTLDAA